jgi:hypothetical protein
LTLSRDRPRRAGEGREFGFKIAVIARGYSACLDAIKEDFSEGTLGALFWDDPEEGLEFLCFTLEDQFQEVKVPGETRIPDGCYPLTLRTYGGMHERYLQRYPSLHKGMIEIREVPGFTHILIHTGNTDDHTAGCLLVGDEVRTNEGKRKGFLGNSRPAYLRLYRQVTWQIEQGHQVILDVVSR